MVGIDSLMANHSKNFGRSRDAVRRTALDLILNECLTVMVSIVVPVAFPVTSTSTRKATFTPIRKATKQPTIALNALLRPGTT